MPLSNQPLVIAGRTFRSRLILGTGKFSAPEVLRDALEASGAEMVTRRFAAGRFERQEGPVCEHPGVY